MAFLFFGKRYRIWDWDGFHPDSLEYGELEVNSFNLGKRLKARGAALVATLNWIELSSSYCLLYLLMPLNLIK